MSSELKVTYNAIPNKENVFYAFQRLITSLTISTIFEPYKESHEEFDKAYTRYKNSVLTLEEQFARPSLTNRFVKALKLQINI